MATADQINHAIVINDHKISNTNSLSREIALINITKNVDVEITDAPAKEEKPVDSTPLSKKKEQRSQKKCDKKALGKVSVLVVRSHGSYHLEADHHDAAKSSRGHVRWRPEHAQRTTVLMTLVHSAASSSASPSSAHTQNSFKWPQTLG